MKNKSIGIRWFYLAAGTVALLFAGVVYAWSILKAPLAESFGWKDTELALNFTLTMCFFCLGGFVGGLISKRIGTLASLLISAFLSGLGFVLASMLSGEVIFLYLSYGIMAGLGIGIAYNVIISTVSSWFPDKKGLCSGVLMMGFGASALAVGKLASAIIAGPGFRTAYIVLGIALAAVLTASAFILKRPGADTVLPEAKKKASGKAEAFESVEFSTGKMLTRISFWLAFIGIVCLAAVGNSVISFARDLAISVGAEAGLAATLVGVLSICNGLGRIATGALFDKLGRRATMFIANALTILAAGITLLSVTSGSLPLCVAGLCLTGFSYGACPTISSAFISAFYGTKHFPLNFSIMNFNLMGASFMATAANGMLASSGGYTVPFIFLLGLSALSLILTLFIRKP